MQRTQFHLKTYSGESLPLLGELQVTVMCQTQKMQLPLVVTQGEKPVLLGWNWLEKLNLDWSTISKMSQVLAREDILAKYEALFEKGYRHIKLYKASTHIREGAQPIFLKARPVPYALKEKLEQELQRLKDDFRDYLQSESKWLGCPNGVGPQERWFTESAWWLQDDSKQMCWCRPATLYLIQMICLWQ